MAPPTSRHHLRKNVDWKKSKGKFVLLREVSIGPLHLSQDLHKGRSCAWTAGGLQCQLQAVPGGWTMVLPQGYKWGGSSAPFFARMVNIGGNNKGTRRAFLFHDAAYQGMRRRAIPPGWTNRRRKLARKWADQVMNQILKADGHGRRRTKLVYRFVRWFGAPYSKQKTKRRPRQDHSPAMEGRDRFPEVE